MSFRTLGQSPGGETRRIEVNRLVRNVANQCIRRRTHTAPLSADRRLIREH